MREKTMEGLRVTVLGAGISGVSIARMASRFGAETFASDAAEISAAAMEALESSRIPYEQGGHTDRILGCDIAVASSGFPPDAPVARRLISRGINPVGELDFVLPFVKGRIIGITGSNGKTTTTSLLGRLIAAAGRDCAVGGNIGSPVADLAGKVADFTILELSSFQLHWARDASLAGAIVTNITPDHIDWHGSYANYAAAKVKIADFVEEGGFVIVQERDREKFNNRRTKIKALSWNAPSSAGDISLSREKSSAQMDGSELFRFGGARLLGVHNMENAAMAMAAVKTLGLDVSSARASLASYEAPPHRCALVLKKGGVRYIDDSKGTNIAASVAAMSSIEGPHIVILGGRAKGEDYSELAEPLRRYAKRAYLIGEASREIASSLLGRGYSDFRVSGDMESAVKSAIACARPGDAVLLSPACASWDAYDNYKERGDHFAALVLKLAGETL